VIPPKRFLKKSHELVGVQEKKDLPPRVSVGGWTSCLGFPLPKLFDPCFPISWPSLLVGNCHNYNQVRLDSVEYVVGKMIQ